MRSRATIALLGCALCAVPATAGADAALKKAKRLFGRAEVHFAKGRYQPALELYLEAYNLKPRPGFHFNIAQCYRHLGQHAKAVEHYRRYLEHTGNPKSRAAAQKLLQVSEKALAEQRAASTVDEEQPPDIGGAAVRPGEADPAAAPLQGPGAEARPAEAAAEPPPAEASPAPPVADEKPEDLARKRRRLRPVYFWSGVAVTGTLLLIGTITGSVALSKSSDYNDPNTPQGELQDLKDSGESLRTAANVTFGLGLAAAIGTAALYVFTDFEGRDRAVSAAPRQKGAMVVYGGRF